MKNKNKDVNQVDKKTKIKNIISDVIIILLFIFVAYEMVVRVSGNQLYLFGLRSDVVLSPSMATKCQNPNVQEFLDGHDDQLQTGDLVYSTKVTDSTPLNVYDIVIFKNTNNKLTIHRIVAISPGSLYKDGKDRYLIRADSAKFNDYDGSFTRDDIQAKYTGFKIPFVGYIHNYVSSIPGLIIILGLVVIWVVADYFLEKERIKKKLVEGVIKNENLEYTEAKNPELDYKNYVENVYELDENSVTFEKQSKRKK